MSQLDPEWAIEQINHFLNATEQVPYDNTGGSVIILGTHMRGSETDASELAHVIEQILDRVLPRWTRSPPDEKSKSRVWRHLREQAARARAALERREELREKLGDGAPQMDAGKLHPWVWNAASSLWRTGHFNQSVQQAAVAVNAQTQAKLRRRDVSETSLFQEAFSMEDPTSGRPRLRLMENDGSDTFKSMHRGAKAFAEGLYAGIRNPLNHEVLAEADQQSALENLAAFSILARWVDKAQLFSEGV
jgi:Protein of unknown function (Hypoth_ymh)